MTIMNQQDGKTLNNLVCTSAINLNIIMLKLLVISSHDCQPRPPSEIRQRPKSLPRNEGGTGFIGVEPLFHSQVIASLKYSFCDKLGNGLFNCTVRHEILIL
jgi:hypothetical protein